MNKKNSIFIATSIDGYISDKEGNIDWLQSVPNPDQDDMGYTEFLEGIDALVMGRKTFETVIGFDIPWPYTKPVFVLSTTMSQIPTTHTDKAQLVKGTVSEIIKQIHDQGFYRLYIDGGTNIQYFLEASMIDEMILTTIPIVLGGGSSLFGTLSKTQNFELVDSKIYLKQITQNHYKLIP